MLNAVKVRKKALLSHFTICQLDMRSRLNAGYGKRTVLPAGESETTPKKGGLTLPLKGANYQDKMNLNDKCQSPDSKSLSDLQSKAWNIPQSGMMYGIINTAIKQANSVMPVRDDGSGIQCPPGFRPFGKLTILSLSKDFSRMTTLRY